MKRLKNLVLAVFVSPEFVVILLGALGFTYFNEALVELGKKLQSDAEVWKYLPSLTFAFSATAFGLSSKIRAPLENSSNKMLYEWPLYELLVDRVLVSLWFSIGCGAISLLLWIFGSSLPAPVVGVVFLAATGASATTAFTMLLAHQKLRELIDRYSN